VLPHAEPERAMSYLAGLINACLHQGRADPATKPLLSCIQSHQLDWLCSS
jgi:hypothetical protein